MYKKYYLNFLVKEAEKSPCLYDPLKVNKIITSVNKKEDLVEIKKEEEEINNPYNLFKVLIRTINYQDVVGIEDALEIKKRFNFVKCVSSHGEVQKVSLYDFFRLININPEENVKKILLDIIAKKKAILFKRILNAAKKKSRLIENLLDYKYEQFINTEGADEKAQLLAKKFRDKETFDFYHCKEHIGFDKDLLPKTNEKNNKMRLSNLNSPMSTTSSSSHFLLSKDNSKCYSKKRTLTLKQNLNFSNATNMTSSPISTITLTKKTSYPKINQLSKKITFGNNNLNNFIKGNPSQTRYKHFSSLSKKTLSPDNTTFESSRLKTNYKNYMSNNVSHMNGLNSIDNQIEYGDNSNILSRIKSTDCLSNNSSIFNQFDLLSNISNKKIFLMKDYNTIVNKELNRVNSTNRLSCLSKNGTKKRMFSPI